MKYVKQHFVTGMKVSLPDVLNRMEDGIAAACAAAEAVKVVGVQLHVWCTVVMERTAGHAAAIDRQTVSLCRHLRRDPPLDGFI